MFKIFKMEMKELLPRILRILLIGTAMTIGGAIICTKLKYAPPKQAMSAKDWIGFIGYLAMWLGPFLLLCGQVFEIINYFKRKMLTGQVIFENIIPVKTSSRVAGQYLSIIASELFVMTYIMILIKIFINDLTVDMRLVIKLLIVFSLFLSTITIRYYGCMVMANSFKETVKISSALLFVGLMILESAVVIACYSTLQEVIVSHNLLTEFAIVFMVLVTAVYYGITYYCYDKKLNVG